MLLYLPLESYIQRYTCQWSGAKVGWLERRWLEAGVEYTRIDGDPSPAPRVIKTGVALDAVGRSTYCFSQIAKLLHLAEAGQVTDQDVIYLDDFWTLGSEALPYAFGLMGIKPKCFGFWHAQSVDCYDFTHPMRNWMRSMERGQLAWMDGVFVTCPAMKDEIVLAGLCDPGKVRVTGAPFASDEVMERMPEDYRVFRNRERISRLVDVSGYPTDLSRENQVVWSSRFDAEKDPHFFMDVVEAVVRRRNVTFVVCTSAPALRSNDPTAIPRLRALRARHPLNVEILEGLSKERYYEVLTYSKVQFSSALQEWVSIVLPEASVAGCQPVYPYFRSFPETFLRRPGFMYQHRDVEAATQAVLRAIDLPQSHWSAEAIDGRSWIHRRFDTSWIRMLDAMGVPHAATAEQRAQAAKDPFDPTAW